MGGPNRSTLRQRFPGMGLAADPMEISSSLRSTTTFPMVMEFTGTMLPAAPRVSTCCAPRPFLR